MAELKEPVLDRWIRGQKWMDSWAEFIQKLVGGIYGALGTPGQWLKTLMHGTPVLGHPLHPALTDVPLGAWSVAVVAYLLALATPRVPPLAGDIAMIVGVLSALLAAVAGYTDFHETYEQERRVALTHGLLMTAVILVEALALLLRLGGPATFPLAVALATLATLVGAFGAYFGGHLTFGLGTGVNHNAYAQGPEDFVAVGSAKEFAEGKPKKVRAGDMTALVLRHQGRLYAIGSVCSHAGGPLEEGELDGDVVTCPWHGSRFCVRDGRVRRGPATFRQPPFEVREHGGKVELKLAYPLH